MRRPDRHIALLVAALAIAVALGGNGTGTRAPAGPGGVSERSRPSLSMAGLALVQGERSQGDTTYAELLERYGHPVDGVAGTPADALDSDATLVLFGHSDLPARWLVAVRRFVRTGGRLITGGPETPWLEGLLPETPRWSSDGLTEARVLAPVAETAGVSSVAASGSGSWIDANDSLPVLGDDVYALAAVAEAGRGRILLLSDESVLTWPRIAEADNAQFGLNIAGPRERRVLFFDSVPPARGSGAEGGSGGGSERPQAAAPGPLEVLPSNWKWAIVLLIAAILALMAARARRLGAPDEAARPLAPPRGNFVAAVGESLQRTGDHTAAGNILRRAIRARADVYAPGDPEEAAKRAGLSESERQALLSEETTPEDLILLGSGLARVEQRP